MGLLAQENMLYFLAFGIFICLLVPALIFADEQGIDFFKEKSTLVQEEKCSECSNTPAALSPGLQEKSQEIERMIKGRFNNEQTQLENEVILFIDFNHRFSDAAVKRLVKFKKDNPSWSVKGVIAAGPNGLKEKLLNSRSWFSNDIEFSIDLDGSLVRKFSVAEIPSYIVIYQGIKHKISGRADLNDAVYKLDK